MTVRNVIKILGGIVLVGLVAVIAIQFVPVQRTNPPVVSEPNWDSPQTRALMERACFDCHSNQTRWPAYAYVAPVSWLVAEHVNEGRATLNFSDWARSGNEGEEMIESIQRGEMPMKNYVLLHPEANLTATEQQQLIAGIIVTFGGEGNEHHEAGEHGDKDND
jgi:hypothetical protein